ncbi:MAG: hypothetical protein IAG10_20750 [Planctomycetaceae bacterium]|nr:hypothetical protein [Planctomycetaceae bacterium]
MSQSHSANTPERRLGSLLGILLAVILLSYVGSYAVLYQRGVAEVATYGPDAFFFYLPVRSVNESHDLTWHHRFLVFYNPLNWLHRQWFNGRTPCFSVLWDLS